MTTELKRTTPPPPLDILRVVPELRAFVRPTVRLHPREGEVPTIVGSKIGGPFLWPEDEPFPTTELVGQGGAIPLVPVIQIQDYGLPCEVFPPGVDVFQLLWTPVANPQTLRPELHIRWRRAADTRIRHRAWPEPPREEAGLVPVPCLMMPELVAEFPPLESAEFAALSESVQSKILSDSRLVKLYRDSLSACPATKLGGYPFGLSPSDWPVCACERPMTFFLQLAAWEASADVIDPFGRWLAEEDNWVRWAKDPNRVARTLNPADLEFGASRLLVFVCEQCAGYPTEVRFVGPVLSSR